MDELEIVELINETTTEFNNTFAPELYPEIRIGDFMTITNIGNRATTLKGYGEQDGTQDLDNGLVDENTTVLETESANITAKKAPYLDWAKSAIYTKLGVARAIKIGIALDTVELENLRGVAFRSMQKVALVGHAKRKDVTGMLNNPSVEIENLTTGKKLSDMTGEEAREWFINLFKVGYQRSNGIIMPSTVAIDSFDLLTLSGKYDKNITNGNGAINVLSAIRSSLSEFTGFDVKIIGVPQGLALKAGTKGNARACVYTNSVDVISQDWALAPTASPAFQRSALGFEIPMEAQYTGAMINKLDRIMYVDYLS